MRITLTAIILINVLQLFSIHKNDSLREIINSRNVSDQDKLQAYKNLCTSLQNTDFEQCRKVCYEGIEFAKSVQNHIFENSFNTTIGTTWFYAGDYDSAAVYWVKALKISENVHDTTRIMSSLNNLGVLNTFTKDYKKSLEYYVRSLHFKKIVGTPEAIAITEMNIGINYHYMGNLDSALALFTKVIPIISASENKRAKALLYNNLGSVYTGLEEYEKALNYYSFTEEFEDLLLVNDKAILLQNKGICYFNLKQQDKAIESMNSALELAIQHDMKALKKSIYENLADFYYSTKDFKTAFDFLSQYDIIKDSILNMEKDKVIREIQAKYESEKKDTELLLIKEKVNHNQRIIWTLIIITSLVIISTLIISVMLHKLKLANIKLIKNNHQLDTLNEEIKSAKGEVEKALAFKSEFLANMSHEIRTPLNIIIGFNSMLKKNVADHKLKEFTESIELCSYNLLQFLNDILDMSKIEAGKMQLSTDQVNLKLLVNDLSKLFILKAEEKKIQFLTDYDANIPDYLILDEIRLRQILFNLIGNAIKFTEKGYVKLSVRKVPTNNPDDSQPSEIDLVFDVSDTGIGIPKDQYTIIFESFRQGNQHNMNQSGGTGLGLTISKRLSEMMDGSLTMISEPGKGSTFTLKISKIPLILSPSNHLEKQNVTDALEIVFTGGTILVADDEILNRNLIKVCFEKTPVKILEAVNGIEAYNIAKAAKPDVILMDMKMPFMDGYEASVKIKEDSEIKDIPIFAFSASSLFNEKDEPEKLLFSGYVSKPVGLADLYDEMAKFLPHHKTDPFSQPCQSDITLKQNAGKIKYPVLDENMAKLENDFFPLWAEVSASNAMNRIIDFSESLGEFAKKNNIEPLIVYCEQLLAAGSGFDINTVKKLLSQYPEIIHSLKPN